LGVIAALTAARAAHAGPPYVADDPETTDPGHWEIYNFVSGVGVPDQIEGEAGFDINYGPAKDLQLTAVLPADFNNGSHAGLGDIELAIKYRFLHQSDGSWTPDVAFFPRLFTPTAGPRFGSGRPSLWLPVWAQKDWGAWSLFGGGGPDINPGPGNRNFWLGGVGLSRSVTGRLSLGAEVYGQTAEARGAKDFAGVNFGATYKLSDHWTLMGSAGPGIANARQQDQYEFYAALDAQY
jgi:hypothetical protein